MDMMQNNCDDTNDQLNMLLPLLLMSSGDENETTDRRRRETEQCEQANSEHVCSQFGGPWCTV